MNILIQLIRSSDWQTSFVGILSLIAVSFALVSARTKSRALPLSRFTIAVSFIFFFSLFGDALEHIAAASGPGKVELVLWAIIESLIPLVVSAIGYAVLCILHVLKPIP